MKIGTKDFNRKGHTYIMGILNVTPDSFSDGGRYMKLDDALYHVEEMIGDGMDIVDIGGESTRPGYTVISEDEEIERVAPVIEAVKGRFDIPVSLDTYKSKVASAGIAAGADMINDIWGFKYDKDLAKVIADSGLPCCLAHNRENAEYTSFMKEVLAELEETVETAAKAGIAGEKIILDPGIGFGKKYKNNLEMIDRMEILHSFGYPIMIGTSRKSVIGEALNLPESERMEGTLVTTVFAVKKGALFIRVHDVKENARAVKMAEAILRRND